MRTTIAGPEFAAPAGKEIEVSAEQGLELIEAGYADPVRAAKETATAPAPEEQATAPATEEETTAPEPVKPQRKARPKRPRKPAA